MDMAPVDNPGIELRQEARDLLQHLSRFEPMYTTEYTKPIETITKGVCLCLKMLVDLHEKEFNKAIEAFQKVIQNHPKSDKVPGAKLKIGLTYVNEKNPAKAKEYLNKVIKEHPGSNEAEIAKDRLRKIK